MNNFAKLNHAHAKCGICKSTQAYTNPMAICFWCKKKHCFDHITCGYIRKGQPDNEEYHDICDLCLKQGLGINLQ